MLIHPEFCKAKNTTYWTSLRIQFNLLLVEVAAWDGFIPLTENELAKELGTSIYRIRKFVSECKNEGILKYEAGHYYLTKYVDYHESENKGYVRHFAFLRSKEFQALPLRVQRFILHVLSQRIYMHENMVFRVKLDRLYHHFIQYENEKVMDRPGLFNLYTKKHLIEVLEDVKEIFTFDIKENSKGREILRLRRFAENFENQTKEIIHNRGKHIWVQQQLEEQGFITEELKPQHVNELVSVMDNYVREIGFADTADIFYQAMERAVSSMQFHSLMEGEDEESLRSYFLKIMHEVELEYAERLARQADELNKEERKRKSSSNANLSILLSRMIRKITEKINRLEERWKRRMLRERDHLRESISFKTSIVKHMKDIPGILLEYKDRKKSMEPAPQVPFEPFNWLEVDL